MSFSEAIEKKFFDFADSYSMLDTDSVLVGFSGGADSTVLLSLMKKASLTRSFRLYALHVNHMIRRAEAERDELFCKSFCEASGIPLFVARIDIPSLSVKERKGTEECARDHRYAEFFKYARENGISRIATAHNADDNFETVLFNLSRGCSLTGISGIPPVRDNIIRPILGCPKDEIIGYARENNLAFVYDSTNSDTDYTRNYIRHAIIPKFKELNPAVLSSVTRFCRAARQDNNCLEGFAEKFYDNESVTELGALDNPLLYRVLSVKYRRAAGDSCHLEASHLEALASLIRRAAGNSYVSLPHKLCGAVLNGKFTITAEKDKDSPTAEAYSFPLVRGENSVLPDNSSLSLEVFESTSEADLYIASTIKQNINKKYIYKEIDFDKIDGNLYVRCRQDSDSYRCGGMTRTLKKLMNAKGLPLHKRRTIPIVCDLAGIVWVPGFGVRDGLGVSPHSRSRILIICYSEGDN